LYAGFLDSLLDAINKTAEKPKGDEAVPKKEDVEIIKILRVNFHMSGLGTPEEARFVIDPCFVAHKMVDKDRLAKCTGAS